MDGGKKLRAFRGTHQIADEVLSGPAANKLLRVRCYPAGSCG